jgi:endogenous inhibitor of DNA gyrase (YacG/DUF329 family)
MVLDVEETIGACKKCKKEDYLGDGLCQRCWDKQIGKNRYMVPVPVYNIDGSRVRKQKSYIAKVKCYDCGTEVDYMCEVGRRPTKLKRCRHCNQKRWEDYTRRKNEKEVKL